MRIGLVPSVLAALLMVVAAIRYVARGDQVGAVIAAVAAVMAIVAAVTARSIGDNDGA